MSTPKAPWSTVPGRGHRALETADSTTTPLPKKTNPVRASHAPGTPWAADSLVVCSIQEYEAGISSGATASAAAERASRTRTAARAVVGVTS